MELVLEQCEINAGRKNVEILAGLRAENTMVTRDYFAQLETALCVFNRDVEQIIKRCSAAT